MFVRFKERAFVFNSWFHWIIFNFLFLFSLFFLQNACAETDQNICPKLTGKVIYKNSPQYAQARLDSNYYFSKNQFPEVVVYCKNTNDVQNAIKWARCHKVPIRIRSGGHNHEAFSTGSGAIVIDVSKMKQLKVNQSKQIAVVQPGLTGQELYDHLYQKGLTQVGGTCADVGISGLMLTGGMGPLLRKEGMSCDSLQNLEIVNAQGNILQVSKNKNKDLFWASCGGGGGNFGVVTSMTIKVYPAQSVTWFNIGWDWNQPVDKIISTWQKFLAKDDRRWFSHLDIWPKIFSEQKYNKLPIKALGVFWGTPEEARKELAPLLNIGHPKDQTIKTVNWHQAIELFENATTVFVTSKPEYKSIGAYAMQPLPPAAVKIITDTLRKTNAPFFNVLIFSLGGAAQDIAPSDTAYFYRKAKFFVMYSTEWLKEDQANSQIKEVQALRNKLLPFTKGDYIGNPDRNFKDYLTIYYGENVKKLECIKKKYDPENIFHFQQSIPPAPASVDCNALN